MEPIISPWFFYFLHVCKETYLLFRIIFWVSLPFALLMGLFVTIDYTSSRNKDDHTKMLKVFKISCCICLFSGLISALIPSEKTMYQMLAASLVTPDNINLVEDDIVDFVSKIAEAIQQKMKK